MIQGVKIVQKEKLCLCVIDDFTAELMQLIRKNLMAICYGRARVDTTPRAYSYANTLKEFLERFETKAYATQVGMIGELLAHVILIAYNDSFNSINPFFNMEEKSIKKGFDILIVDEADDNKLWLTEVKSGELGSLDCSNSKNDSLLSIAKNDLNTRLNENESHIWHNAINGAFISIKKEDLKKEIIDILEDCREDTHNNESTSANKNVILTSVLFNDIRDSISIESMEEFHLDTCNKRIFADLMVFSIHKSTLKKVVDFLRLEVDR